MPGMGTSEPFNRAEIRSPTPSFGWFSHVAIGSRFESDYPPEFAGPRTTAFAERLKRLGQRQYRYSPRDRAERNLVQHLGDGGAAV